jgi:Ser/Thr protein kinase RdoA (MazF antagonist)
MMKLSLMQAVVDTLNDTGRSPVADAVLAAWVHDQSGARYFRASANFIFVFEREGQPYILRFAHTSERTADAIHAELAYLRHLAAHKVPVALPIRSLSGRWVESVATTLGVFHAVVFEHLPGQQYDVGDLSLAQFTRWGSALGSLHQAAEGYSGAGRATIHDHLRMLEQQLPAHEGAAWHLLTTLERQIAALPTSDQTFGLIHYDFELDNLLWDDQRVSIVDLDDCAGYWFVADIAFALRDLFDDHAEQIDVTDTRFRAFVTGYRTTRTVTDEELRRLPLFLRIHNLVSFAKLLHAADIDDAHAAPAWAVDLQAKLLRKVQTYRDSFAAAATA